MSNFSWSSWVSAPKKRTPIKPAVLLPYFQHANSGYSVFISEQAVMAGGMSLGFAGVAVTDSAVLMVDLVLDNRDHNDDLHDQLVAGSPALYAAFTCKLYKGEGVESSTGPTAVYLTDKPPFAGAEPITVISNNKGR